MSKNENIEIIIDTEATHSSDYKRFLDTTEFQLSTKDKEFIKKREGKKRLDKVIEKKFRKEMVNNLKEIYHSVRKDYTIKRKKEVTNRQHKVKKNDKSIQKGETQMMYEANGEHMKFRDLVYSMGKQIREDIKNGYLMIFKTTTIHPDWYYSRFENEFMLNHKLNQQKILFGEFQKRVYDTHFEGGIKTKSVVTYELTKKFNIHQHSIDLIKKEDLSTYLKSIYLGKRINGIGRVELVFNDKVIDIVKDTVKDTTFQGTGKGKIQYVPKYDKYDLSNSKVGEGDMVYFKFKENDTPEDEEKMVAYLVKYIGKGKKTNESIFNTKNDPHGYNWNLTNEEIFLEHFIGLNLLTVSKWFWNTGVSKENILRYGKIVGKKYEWENQNNQYNQKRSFEKFIEDSKKEHPVLTFSDKKPENFNSLKPLIFKKSFIILNWSDKQPKDWNREYFIRKYNYINNQRRLRGITKDSHIFKQTDLYALEKNDEIPNYLLRKNDHIRSSSIDNFGTYIEFNYSQDFSFVTRYSYIDKNMGKLELKEVDILHKFKEFIDKEDQKNKTFFLKNYWINKMVQKGVLIDNKDTIEVFGKELEVLSNKSEEISFKNLTEKNKEVIRMSHNLEFMDEVFLFGTYDNYEKQLILNNYLNLNGIHERKGLLEEKIVSSFEERGVDYSNQQNLKEWQKKALVERNETHGELIDQRNELYYEGLENQMNISGISYENPFIIEDYNNNNTSNEVIESWFNIKNEIDLEMLQLHKDNKEDYYKYLIFSTLVLGYKEGHSFLNSTGLKFYSKGLITDKILEDYREFFNIVNDKWFMRPVFNNIIELSNLIKEKLQVNTEIDFDIDSLDFQGITLHELQRNAIELALRETIFVLSGGAGSGKTFTSSYIIKVLKQSGMNMKILASTGAAAKRISEVGGIEASTIHKELKLNHYGVSSLEKKLDYDVIIVDESSMIDSFLAYQLLSNVEMKTKIIFIGDHNQLPPVSVGSFFKEITINPNIPSIRLTKTFRQGETSPVLKLATEILNNECSFDFTHKIDYDSELQLINDWGDVSSMEKIISKLFKKYGKDFQVISQTNKLKDNINRFVQKMYNNTRIPNTKFRIKDKVINTENDYDKNIMNGQIGTIHSFTQDDKDRVTILVIFDNGVIEKFTEKESKKLDLAYCITIHKSQGQEYKSVMVVGDNKDFIGKQLLYTGITRSKQHCFIYMNKEIFEKGYKTNDRLYHLGNKVYDIPNNYQLYL